MYQNPRRIDISYYDEKFFQSWIQRQDAQCRFCENRFDSLLAIIRPGQILDIGCGTGEFLAVAQKRGGDCYGVDVSRWAANYANRFLKNEVRIGTVEDAKFPESFFDVVYSRATLEHYHNPLITMRETRRILKPGGLAILEVPDEKHLKAKMLIRDIIRGKYIPSEGEARQHLYFFTKESLCKVVRHAGFHIIQAKIEGWNSPPGRLLTFVRKINWKMRILLWLIRLKIDVKVGLGNAILVIATPATEAMGK